MNIYQIQEELLATFDELEANGGEITPELEEKLAITQDEFKDKIKDYAGLIKHLEAGIKECKEEEARIKAFRVRKEKLQDKLEEIVIAAIIQFGDTKKSGVKYIDYGTGEVAVNKSVAVDINDSLVNDIGKYIQNRITFEKNCNQLDVYNALDENSAIEEIKHQTGYPVTDSDLNHVDLSLQITVPIKDLFTGEGYGVIREIAKYSDFYKLTADVSKSTVKPILQENGSALPNIAKLKENKNLKIK